MQYFPTLIPTRFFTHQFAFAEENKVQSRHCVLRDDTKKWIMGLCKNIATNIGHFYLNNTDSECLNDEKNGKSLKMINLMKETWSKRWTG